MDSLLETLAVEIERPGPYLTLSRSALGGAPLAPSTGALVWSDLLASARSVQTKRGGTRDGVTTRITVGTLSIVLVNAGDPTSDLDVKPNTRIRVRHRATGLALFTGRISDVHVDYTRDGDTFVTITAVDSVQQLANTPRFGAAGPAEYEPWETRAQRVLQSYPGAWSVPSAPSVIPYAASPLDSPWNFGVASPAQRAEADAWAAPGDVWGTTYGLTALQDAYLATTSYAGLWFNGPTLRRRAVAGLVPGQRYRAHLVICTNHPDVRPTVAVQGIASVATTSAGTRIPVQLPGRAITWSPWIAWAVDIDFTATSETHHLTMQQTSTYDLFLVTASIQGQTSTMCASTVYESSVANHLDLITNSAGAGWYVDATGVVRVIGPLTAPAGLAASASDTASADPAHIAITEAAIAYDTTGIVNALTLTNHARAWSADQGDWIADDQSLGPWLDLTSGATWGTRSAALETCIADVPGTVWATSTTDLAARLITDRSTPEALVSSVKWNAGRAPELAAALDIYARLVAQVRTVTTDARVIALEHDITPARWMVTAHLIEKGF